MNKPNSHRPRWVERLVRRIRWYFAAPILRPILAEWEEFAKNAQRSAQMQNAPRDWRIEMNALSESLHCRKADIEHAFGCTSIDIKKRRIVRHYH